MRVLKFGGTSLGDADRIARAARLVVEATRHDDRVVVVASAMAGVTDTLVEALDLVAGGRSPAQPLRQHLGAHHLAVLDRLGVEPADRRVIADGLHRRLLAMAEDLDGMARRDRARAEERARVLATGERLSTPMLAAAIRARGRRAAAIDATEVIVTDDTFLEARPDEAATRRTARRRLASLPLATVPVITGFFGAEPGGQPTLLGRGGSDVSATLLGAALEARRVEIWTDVDGILTADPKRDRRARLYERLSYEEAERLALDGAEVLHPRAVGPAARAGVPIEVRNSFHPERAGTLIAAEGLEAARGSAAPVHRPS
ncbi:MAG: aspartate kinase [Acidobacteriota bacterium]